ncbi:MAG: DUF433 domain-containing protein [Taibaiella sp.]|nr:DUF433 domain-containing protein [Taibaiella sp.]
MWQDYIEQKKEVLGGRPVIKNTRISVDMVLEKIGKGVTIEQLLEIYPEVTKIELLACISFDTQHFTR